MCLNIQLTLFSFFRTAYPELGLYVTKRATQFISNRNVWVKLNEWQVNTQLIGAYNYDSQLINSEYVVAPNTGIYYATAIAPVNNINTVTEVSLALVNGDDSNEDSFGLLSKQHGAGNVATLSIAGFVKIYAGQKITVQVKGTANFEVSSSASFSLHYIGPTGAVPAYLAQVDSNIALDNDAFIKPFITEGRAKLYRSLSGNQLNKTSNY